MASYYVYSGAAGAANGTSWADAYTTLVAAFSGKAAGDVFYLAHDHAETQAVAMTLTSPGTAAAPCKIICVNRAGSVPPVSADLRTTATISTTGARDISFAGHAIYCGVVFTAGSGASFANLFWTSISPWWHKFINCKLALGGTSTSNRIEFGAVSTAIDANQLELVNTTVSFAHVSQGIVPRMRLLWTNTPSAILGTMPTALFLSSSGLGTFAHCRGVDFSAMGSGKSLINVGASEGFNEYHFTDIKIDAAVGLTTGTVAGVGGTQVTIENYGSGATNYKYYFRGYAGIVEHETTIVVTGGASDGTTPVSRKMTTNANSLVDVPLHGQWLYGWIETVAATTVTLAVVTDNVTLTDAEAWIEVEYLGTSGFPLSVAVTDAAADILATGANQTTDGSTTWTTTGLATPVKQSLSVSFTPTMKGPFRARAVLAKPSTTMYVNPKILSSSGRQWMSSEGFVNEGAASSGGARQVNVNGGADQ